jgi:hypothetical protein
MCSSLETIQFNAGIEKLDPYAFSFCSKLRSVIFEEADRPNYWAAIENNCFFDCENLSSVTLSHSVRKIGESSFDGCNLSYFYVPNSIESIGNYAFANNKNLTTVIFEENEHGAHCCDSYSYYTRNWNSTNDNGSSCLEYYTVPSDIVGSYRSMLVGTYNRLEIRNDGTCYFDGIPISECDFSDISARRKNYAPRTGTWYRKENKITIIPDDNPSTHFTATIEQYGWIELFNLSYQKEK